MSDKKLTPPQKALELNLNRLIYGTLAEIGAGQEVARHFFHTGGASGTVAKSISAYDMQVSDAIYGKDRSGRYVSKSRLNSMLDAEFNQLLKDVSLARPPGTRLFAFADTIAAKAYKSDKTGQGWMGIQLQAEPGAAPCKVILHVNLLHRV